MNIDLFLKALQLPLWFLVGRNGGISKWGYLLVIAVQLTVAGMVFRVWIGPFVLRSISKRVRVRSVSLRSIRGIFIRTASMTFSIDRIGLAYHPSGSSARRFSIKIEGFFAEVHEGEACIPLQRSPQSGRLVRLPTLADFAPSFLARKLWSLYSKTYAGVEPYVRPIIRTFFVACIRIVIRCLPALTQVIDFELERALVTYTGLPEAHFTIHKAALSTTVTFSNLENVIGSEAEFIRVDRRKQGFMNFSHLRTRVARSAKRVWDRAWGQTKGQSSFALTICDISTFASNTKWPTTASRSSLPDPGSKDSASRFDRVIHRSHRNAMCFSFPGSTDFVASFNFGPRSGFIEEHSIEAALKVSAINISVGRLLEFARILKKAKSDELTPTRPSENRDAYMSSPALSRIKTWAVSQGAHQQHSRSKLSLFRAVKFHMKEITLQFKPQYTDRSNSRTFIGHISSLIVSFRLGVPSEDTLYSAYLGRPTVTHTTLDAPVLSCKMSTKELTIQRRDSAENAPLVRVIYIGPVELNSSITQWSLLAMPRPRHLSGDPNASLVAIKLTIVSPQLSERIDVISDILADIPHSEPVAYQAQSSGLLSNVPRIFLGIEVNDVAACLTIGGYTEPSSLILSSTQCNMSLSTYFISLATELPNTRISRLGDYTPVELEVSLESILGPAFVTYLQKSLALDSSNEVSGHIERPGGFGDPLLSLSPFELKASCRLSGGFFESVDQVVLDSSSALADFVCIADAASLELWQPEAVTTLKNLLKLLTHVGDERLSKRKNHGNIFDGFPTGISVHLAVGQIGIILTHKDINPGDDLGLSRGIALKSGLAIQYSSLDSCHQSTLFSKRFSYSRDRKRPIPSGMLNGIASDASTNGEERKISIHCIAWDTSLRTCVATEFAADHAYDIDEENDELKANEFLWIKRIEIEVSAGDEKSLDSERGQAMRVIASIPFIHASLRLFEAYCMLLAFSTLRSLLGPREPRRKQTTLWRSTSFQATLGTVQVVLHFPLQEEASMRVNRLSLRKSTDGVIIVEGGTIFTWVPVVTNHSKWEELIRLRRWKVTCTGSSSDSPSFAIECDGARLRIPYSYILADLILDINVSFKSLRHLARLVPTGTFSHMPVPTSEDAKVVPTMNIKIGTFAIEAADDPLESKLGLIWHAGFDATRTCLEREEAFDAKVAAINAVDLKQLNTPSSPRFTAQHTVSVSNAHDRLLQVHAISWISLHKERRDEQQRREDDIRRQILGDRSQYPPIDVAPLVNLSPSSKAPPLIRLMFHNVSLSITQPLFSNCDLPDFLHEFGGGLPRDAKYTLLIPFHMNLALGSTRLSLRDYPISLLNIPASSSGSMVSWAIDTDLVIAEEIGTPLSVIWKDCLVVPASSEIAGTEPLYLSVPKTTMPIKSYANPVINVLCKALTEFCWGVSYNPALQDVMRVIDTLSSPPPDPSPTIGFWDKMRLILHWRVKITFADEVQLILKGSRDPYSTNGNGAGFAFRWSGDTEMTIGHQNQDNELFQVASDTMLVVIPDFDNNLPDVTYDDISEEKNTKKSSQRNINGGARKICAKFCSGIRWGIGFILERTCSVSCPKCNGTFSCRLFNFKPHYEVMLEPKSIVPREKTGSDSFNEFRSDFIHLSTSLISSIRNRQSSPRYESSSFHLTPKTFAHFWSWWELFDRFLSIPIRQGKQFPNARPPSKKFGRHLATLKYRFSVPRLFISHVYIDESRESWSDGVINCVGIKALVDLFEADLHQREQEATITGLLPNTTKKIRHKPFYAAEVVLAGLQLRAIVATFSEPVKRLIDMEDSRRENKYKGIGEDEDDASSYWMDLDDFAETDWRPDTENSSIRLLPIASCPRFSYFRRSSGLHYHAQLGDNRQAAFETSRFGSEETHVCLMGKESSVHQIQADIVEKRVTELKTELDLVAFPSDPSLDRIESKSEGDCQHTEHEQYIIQKKIGQLEQYIKQLHETDDQESPNKGGLSNYLMPSDISCPDDWTEFDNVYQFHCPNFSLSNSTRDILTQYYYCSRSRRGFEYHMATRAVKFIRDQANSLRPTSLDTEDKEKKTRNPTGAAAQAAAQALRKILIGNEGDATAVHAPEVEDSNIFNPMDGWSEGVSLKKSHFCLLLKPQIVLRSEATKGSVCVLAAVQATMQAFAIVDTANVEDPISGRVMTRSHATLSGLQVFSPSAACRFREHGIPMEVLIDLRAESKDFSRLVPQTNATFRYDKFNRLRLHNNVTSVVVNSADQLNSHLQHHMDLVDIKVPRFTTSADSKGFEAIANVITNLLLHSDSVHKLHLNEVETLLFRYDFTDLHSAADVVEGLQSRLRRAVEKEHSYDGFVATSNEELKIEMMKIKAHIFLLTEELNLIFDAIKLAQDKMDEKYKDQKSALKVHASSKEVSWGMIGESRDLIAKLAVRGIDFSWLSRQDGSTVNALSIGDLQAFDGSPDAEWPEILTKYHEPSSHPLVKRGVFVHADWTVLAPVGGITIYEQFVLEFHPMRLQLEAKVGRAIMEYVWPARRDRMRLEGVAKTERAHNNDSSHTMSRVGTESSEASEETEPRPAVSDLDHSEHSMRTRKRFSVDGARPTLAPKSVTSSRSFSDLRLASRQNTAHKPAPMSSEFLLIDRDVVADFPPDILRPQDNVGMDLSPYQGVRDDAAEMKTRSSQTTFILVRIASMHLLLSFRKDGSFFCRDARIRTRELQYRNRTLSFEELADQFIPSDPTWRGWVRVALHQPLVPVLPVARELLSKTKWIAAKSKVTRQAKKISPAIKAAVSNSIHGEGSDVEATNDDDVLVPSDARGQSQTTSKRRRVLSRPRRFSETGKTNRSF